MTVGTKKAIFGITLSVVITIFAVPAVYWFLVRSIDGALGLTRIIGSPASEILAAASLLVGVFWVLWAYSYLLFVGKGLPLELFGFALHPTKVLVTTGPYAYTRHPGMIGLLFLLLGVAFLQGSVSGLILVPVVAAVLSLYLVLFEERGLEKRFTKDYPDYRKNVPLLIPRYTPYIQERAHA